MILPTLVFPAERDGEKRKKYSRVCRVWAENGFYGKNNNPINSFSGNQSTQRQATVGRALSRLNEPIPNPLPTVYRGCFHTNVVTLIFSLVLTLKTNKLECFSHKSFLLATQLVQTQVTSFTNTTLKVRLHYRKNCAKLVRFREQEQITLKTYLSTIFCHSVNASKTFVWVFFVGSFSKCFVNTSNEFIDMTLP